MKVKWCKLEASGEKFTTKVEGRKKEKKKEKQTNSNNKSTRKAILVESNPKRTGDILNPVKVNTAARGNR